MKNTNQQWLIKDVLSWTIPYFKSKNIENYRLDAEIILAHILGKDRLYLYVHYDQPLTSIELERYRQSIAARAKNIPVAYIISYKEFMGINFFVTKDVLIPRPDTEVVVETAIEYLRTFHNPVILDLCTGSGAIIVSLLNSLPTAIGLASDISLKALDIAKHNADNVLKDRNCLFLHSDLFENIKRKNFDCIISNPPYIVDALIDNLAPELKFEPKIALSGGMDGLDFYRRIIKDADNFLKSNGLLILESGINQASSIVKLAQDTGHYKLVDIRKDYNSIERALVFRNIPR